MQCYSVILSSFQLVLWSPYSLFHACIQCFQAEILAAAEERHQKAVEYQAKLDALSGERDEAFGKVQEMERLIKHLEKEKKTLLLAAHEKDKEIALQKKKLEEAAPVNVEVVVDVADTEGTIDISDISQDMNDIIEQALLLADVQLPDISAFDIFD